MLPILFIVMKAGAACFAVWFIYFAGVNFVIGFKEGLAQANKPNYVASMENRRLRRRLRENPKADAKPVTLVEPEIDVEQYYEEQLRLESIPRLTIYNGG